MFKKEKKKKKRKKKNSYNYQGYDVLHRDEKHSE